MKFLLLIPFLVWGCAVQQIDSTILYDEGNDTISEICKASSWHLLYDTSKLGSKACGGEHSAENSVSNDEVLTEVLRLRQPRYSD